jgi:hypothetical protein
MIALTAAERRRTDARRSGRPKRRLLKIMAIAVHDAVVALRDMGVLAIKDVKDWLLTRAG